MFQHLTKTNEYIKEREKIIFNSIQVAGTNRKAEKNQSHTQHRKTTEKKTFE